MHVSKLQMNNQIIYLHEKSLCSIYNDKLPSFEALLMQVLVIDMREVLRGLASTVFKETF